MKKTLLFVLIAGIAAAALFVCGGGSAETLFGSPAKSQAATKEDYESAEAARGQISFIYQAKDAEEYMERFCERLSELSGGRIVGKAFAAEAADTERAMIEDVKCGNTVVCAPGDAYTLSAVGMDDWTVVMVPEEDREGLTGKDAPLGAVLDEEYQEHGLIRLGGISDGNDKAVAGNAFADGRSILCSKEWYLGLSETDRALVEQAAAEAVR